MHTVIIIICMGFSVQIGNMYRNLSPFCFQIRFGRIEFFPLLQALALEVEEDETGKQLDELKMMVEKVLMRFEEEVRELPLEGCVRTILSSLG